MTFGTTDADDRAVHVPAEVDARRSAGARQLQRQLVGGLVASVDSRQWWRTSPPTKVPTTVVELPTSTASSTSVLRGRRVWASTARTSSAMSSCGAECVNPPTATRSTPHAAYAATVSRRIVPDASSSTRSGSPGREVRDRLGAPVGREVVEQHVAGAGVDGLVELGQRGDLDLDVATTGRRERRAGRLRHAAGDGDVVVLDQQRVGQPDAVVDAAAGDDGRLLQQPQPGVVLRVSRTTQPVPATVAAKAAVRVATPERWVRKFRAVRSPTRIDASGPRPRPSTCPAATASPSRTRGRPSTSGSTAAKVRATRSVPATTPSARATSSASPGHVRRDRRGGGGVGGAALAPESRRARPRGPRPAHGRRPRRRPATASGSSTPSPGSGPRAGPAARGVQATPRTAPCCSAVATDDRPVGAVDEHDRGLAGAGLGVVEVGVRDDDDGVPGVDQPRRGAVQAHHAGAALALDDVGLEPCAVVVVDDLDLLVDQQVGGVHQVAVDR